MQALAYVKYALKELEILNFDFGGGGALVTMENHVYVPEDSRQLRGRGGNFEEQQSGNRT